MARVIDNNTLIMKLVYFANQPLVEISRELEPANSPIRNNGLPVCWSAACVFLHVMSVLHQCKACTSPISADPALKEVSGPALRVARGDCFVEICLELAAVAVIHGARLRLYDCLVIRFLVPERRRKLGWSFSFLLVLIFVGL